MERSSETARRTSGNGSQERGRTPAMPSRRRATTRSVKGKRRQSGEIMGLTTFSYPECSCQGSDYPVFGPELVSEQSQLRDVYGEIVGTSSALRRVMQLIDMVAGGDSTALLLGET